MRPFHISKKIPFEFNQNSVVGHSSLATASNSKFSYVVAVLKIELR